MSKDVMKSFRVGLGSGPVRSIVMLQSKPTNPAPAANKSTSIKTVPARSAAVPAGKAASATASPSRSAAAPAAARKASAGRVRFRGIGGELGADSGTYLAGASADAQGCVPLSEQEIDAFWQPAIAAASGAHADAATVADAESAARRIAVNARCGGAAVPTSTVPEPMTEQRLAAAVAQWEGVPGIGCFSRKPG